MLKKQLKVHSKAPHKREKGSPMEMKKCAFPGCGNEIPDTSLSAVCGVHPQVFLGGTCGNNDWRDGFIERVVARGVPRSALFNPQLPPGAWNEEAQRQEDDVKAYADLLFFYLGDPQEKENRASTYSVLETTFALYERPARSVVVFDSTGMPSRSAKSNNKAGADLKKRFPAAPIFFSLEEAEDWLVARLGRKQAA